jgi:hypothetical protein
MCFPAFDDIKWIQTRGDIIAVLSNERKGDKVLYEFWGDDRGLHHKMIGTLDIVLQ